MKSEQERPLFGLVLVLLSCLAVAACGGSTAQVTPASEIGENEADDNYIIGAGDVLQVFVWGYEDLSTEVSVRPDGYISTPLVEDMQAAGKTPTQLARSVETALAEFVRSPNVTVIVRQFVGEYNQQIRVVGQATEPKSLNYRSGMTLLDVMIEVGGLGEFAAGNKAKVVRKEGGEEITINVRLKDLLNRGDMDENIAMKPGDVLIIPESIF